MFGQRKSRFPVLHPRFEGDLLVDRNGRLWIGTQNGLWDYRDYRYVPMRARYVARAHGPVHYLYADTASTLVTLSADLKAAQARLSGSIEGVR